ncbi:response regulator [Flavobacterium sp. UMI-01]|uniref:response regulator n=1 Tax=Flavobacterium sp. UMI-01 TaxID=1441053 RepID=UPI001C7CEA76|nr:response regulator [Flavobacterium sp. UMI-01]GIZ08171.1 hypothetical protein FUMI01_08980 [Flavobacterium sp. UMI-01]
MLHKPFLIYLVDDDKEDRMFFREALDEIDIPVIIKDFDNGVSLMEDLLDAENILPDAIFLDLNMPLMNGEECIEDIRTEAQFSKIPIIIYSTYVDETTAYRLQMKGANWYLIKPESFDKLKKLLAKSLAYIHQKQTNESDSTSFVITTV